MPVTAFFTANGAVLFFSKEAKSDCKKNYKTSDRSAVGALFSKPTAQDERKNASTMGLQNELNAQ